MPCCMKPLTSTFSISLGLACVAGVPAADIKLGRARQTNCLRILRGMKVAGAGIWPVVLFH